MEVLPLVQQAHLQADFLAVQSAGSNQILGVEPQQGEDILADIAGGGGRQRAYGGTLELRNKMAQAQV